MKQMAAMATAGIIASPSDYWAMTRMEADALIKDWNKKQRA